MTLAAQQLSRVSCSSGDVGRSRNVNATSRRAVIVWTSVTTACTAGGSRLCAGVTGRKIATRTIPSTRSRRRVHPVASMATASQSGANAPYGGSVGLRNVAMTTMASQASGSHVCGSGRTARRATTATATAVCSHPTTRAASYDMCGTPYTTPSLKTIPGTDMLPDAPIGIPERRERFAAQEARQMLGERVVRRQTQIEKPHGNQEHAPASGPRDRAPVPASQQVQDEHPGIQLADRHKAERQRAEWQEPPARCCAALDGQHGEHRQRDTRELDVADLQGRRHRERRDDDRGKPQDSRPCDGLESTADRHQRHDNDPEIEREPHAAEVAEVRDDKHQRAWKQQERRRVLVGIDGKDAHSSRPRPAPGTVGNSILNPSA